MKREPKREKPMKKHLVLPSVKIGKKGQTKAVCGKSYKAESLTKNLTEVTCMCCLAYVNRRYSIDELEKMYRDYIPEGMVLAHGAFENGAIFAFVEKPIPLEDEPKKKEREPYVHMQTDDGETLCQIPLGAILIPDSHKTVDKESVTCPLCKQHIEIGKKYPATFKLMALNSDRFAQLSSDVETLGHYLNLTKRLKTGDPENASLKIEFEAESDQFSLNLTDTVIDAIVDSMKVPIEETCASIENQMFWSDLHACRSEIENEKKEESPEK